MADEYRCNEKQPHRAAFLFKQKLYILLVQGFVLLFIQNAHPLS